MGKKDQTTADAAFETTSAPAAKTLLGPLDVQQKEFRVSRFGGYRMRDVDEFLDTITDSMSALAAENERLRDGAPAPVVGAPDLDDVARQADEIIQRARTEAARIVADARSQGATGASSPQDRAAVNAFLTKEREFLQALAGLVQGHAETVKGMSKSVRNGSASTAAAGTSATPPPAAEPQKPEAKPSSPAATTAAKTAEPVGTTVQEPVAAPRNATQVPESDAAVRVGEPQPASVARADGDDEAGEGDRSLRDLFWGED